MKKSASSEDFSAFYTSNYQKSASNEAIFPLLPPPSFAMPIMRFDLPRMQRIPVPPTIRVFF